VHCLVQFLLNKSDTSIATCVIRILIIYYIYNHILILYNNTNWIQYLPQYDKQKTKESIQNNNEIFEFSRTLKEIDDNVSKSSDLCEQIDKVSLSPASTGSSIKAWRKLLETTLLDPIVWLSSFHKEPEFSFPRPTRSDAFPFDFSVPDLWTNVHR